MIQQLLRHVISAMRGAALRRAVAVVCAVAFLAAGAAHCIHHFEGPGATIQALVDTGTPDDRAVPAKTFPVSFECPACSVIAIDVPVQAFVPYRLLPEDWTPSRPDLDRSHPPLAETPPPITTI